MLAAPTIFCSPMKWSDEDDDDGGDDDDGTNGVARESSDCSSSSSSSSSSDVDVEGSVSDVLGVLPLVFVVGFGFSFVSFSVYPTNQRPNTNDSFRCMTQRNQHTDLRVVVVKAGVIKR